MTNAEDRLLLRWTSVKRGLRKEVQPPIFREGEIWWTSIGENIGIEINGKGTLFTRPVLIFKKFSQYGFMGIPLTTQEHGGKWYSEFVFQGKKVSPHSPRPEFLVRHVFLAYLDNYQTMIWL